MCHLANGIIPTNNNQIIIELNEKEIVKANLNQSTIPHTNPDGKQNKCPHVPDAVGVLPREGFVLLPSLGAAICSNNDAAKF